MENLQYWYLRAKKQLCPLAKKYILYEEIT